MIDNTKPDWQENLKSVTKGMGNWLEKHASGLTTFSANHGTKSGIAAGCLAVAAGSATAVIASFSGDPEAAEALRIGSNATMLAGFLTMGAGAVAETVAKVHLKGVDSLFEGAETTQPIDANPRSGHVRGATPVDDRVLSNPAFQRAIQEVYGELQNDPETRAQMTEMLKGSPGARQAFLNAQMNIEGAKERHGTSMPVSEASHSLNTDQDDRPEGPSLH